MRQGFLKMTKEKGVGWREQKEIFRSEYKLETCQRLRMQWLNPSPNVKHGPWSVARKNFSITRFIDPAMKRPKVIPFGDTRGRSNELESEKTRKVAQITWEQRATEDPFLMWIQVFTQDQAAHPWTLSRCKEGGTNVRGCGEKARVSSRRECERAGERGRMVTRTVFPYFIQEELVSVICKAWKTGFQSAFIFLKWPLWPRLQACEVNKKDSIYTQCTHRAERS